MTRMLSCLTLTAMALFLVGPQSFAAEPTGDDYLEYHKPLLGNWKVTIQEGEKVYSGTATWELGAKREMLCGATGSGRPPRSAGLDRL